MLLTRMLDTTIRGIVYQAAGTSIAEVLAAGAERVSAVTCEDSRIPYALLPPRPRGGAGWLAGGARGYGDCDGHPGQPPIRSNRSARIRAVAPQMRCSPTQ